MGRGMTIRPISANYVDLAPLEAFFERIFGRGKFRVTPVRDVYRCELPRPLTTAEVLRFKKEVPYARYEDLHSLSLTAARPAPSSSASRRGKFIVDDDEPAYDFGSAGGASYYQPPSSDTASSRSSSAYHQ